MHKLGCLEFEINFGKLYKLEVKSYSVDIFEWKAQNHKMFIIKTKYGFNKFSVRIVF